MIKIFTTVELYLNLLTYDNYIRNNSLKCYDFVSPDLVTVNFFINGVDSLNTSLLLAVQRLAKIAENSSKDATQEGKDTGLSQTDSGRCVILTNL